MSRKLHFYTYFTYSKVMADSFRNVCRFPVCMPYLFILVATVNRLHTVSPVFTVASVGLQAVFEMKWWDLISVSGRQNWAHHLRP